MDNFGMTPEEARRRQQLIDNLLANGHTDLAADVAKGPYRMNGNPSNAGPTGTWSAPPPQGSQPQPAQPYGEVARTSNSASLMQSPTIPPTRAAGPPTQAGVYPTAGPSVAQGNPRYDSPPVSMSDQVRSGGSQPTINIHVTGTVPSEYKGYPTAQSQGMGPSYPPGTGLDGNLPPSWMTEAAKYEDAGLGAWPGHQQQQNQKDYFVNQQMNRMNPFPPATPYANFGVRPPAPFNNSLSGYPGGAATWTPPYGGAPLPPGQPALTAADFGPAQQMFDLGIRRPTPMAQIQAPFTDTGWGNLSR